MRAGRFVCVGIPILLTIGAIIAFMVATLSGIAHQSLYIFSVDLEDLRLDENTLESAIEDLNLGDIGDSIGQRDVEPRALTAGQLGLGRKYEVTLWGYCEITDDGKECSKGEYNWASKHIRTDVLDDLGSVANVEIELPEEIDTAIDIFSSVTRYTEIAFITALAVLGLELFIGIFSNCTRIISCLTWLIGLAAIILCLVAAGLATAMGAVIVGAVEATASEYGVKGHLNTRFLATIWIGAGFAVAASLFWLFTICCCKPEHRKRDGGDDNEKLIPKSGYYPIGGGVNDHEMRSTAYHNQFQPTYGQDYSHAPTSHSGGRSDAAYEPYSHRA
ncbi:hypothetical protein ACRE_057470 [Hapsidospora chrysogenum ATCC 11550]|uniref:SUR7 family protein-like protein n=1 Tax=Hapsidospora chrysogenum (strain ATCC 11550 / CBS 779.69 / DSM 880 / IAM 14645 / JCM 23072 / IMI 49137) TaxID=857340 RepID=A0A086T294_HAPC1|nr:hypothetical protein ACRE_057470 [Hapsidospora chrysogenum ATCC 11550]